MLSSHAILKPGQILEVGIWGKAVRQAKIAPPLAFMDERMFIRKRFESRKTGRAGYSPACGQ